MDDAASTASSTLRFTEKAEAQRQHTGADEHGKNGISGHDIPNITDHSADRAGVGQNAGNSSSFLQDSSFL